MNFVLLSPCGTARVSMPYEEPIETTRLTLANVVIHAKPLSHLRRQEPNSNTMLPNPLRHSNVQRKHAFSNTANHCLGQILVTYY